MPTWVYCTLTISGDKEELSVVRNKIVDNHIFESLCPTPKDFDDTPARFVIGEEVTPNEKLNLGKIGVTNGNCFNYGIKWNDVDTQLLSEDDNHLKYETSFVWSLPRAVIVAISMNYSNLRFTFEDITPDYGEYYGEIAWENGEVIFDNIIREDIDPVLLDQSSWKQKWVYRFQRISRHLHCFWSKILRNKGILVETTDDIPF